MSAPNRAAEVEAIVRQHPETFQGDGATVDDRKRALLPVICRSLNTIDGPDAWGLLKKNDQGGKIPADIIVWRQTMEHFDVLTDSGPMWGAHGPVGNPAWVFESVGGGTSQPSQPNQPPASSSFEQDVRAAIGRIEGELKAIRSQKPEAPVVMAPDVEFPNYAGDTVLPLPAFLGGNRSVHVTLKPEGK